MDPLEHLGIGVGCYTPDGTAVYFNSVVCEALGAPREELVGKNADEIFSPDIAAELHRRLAEVLRLDQPLRHQDNVPLAGGERWFVSVYSVVQREGEPLVMVAVTDVTHFKDTEEALAKSEALFRQVFELLPVGLWIADGQGKLLRGNPAGVAIWGGSPLVGRQDYGVFKARRLPSGEELAPKDWALAKTVQQGVTIENELLEIDGFDGVTRTILNFTAPVLDDEGDVQAAVVVNQDISEQQRLQAQLAQARRMESIGRLAGGVAHDFNNLLTVILDSAELVLEELPSESPLRQELEHIAGAGMRAAKLTRQLLAFSRRQPQQARAVDVDEVVLGLERLLQRLLGEELELRLELDSSPWTVSADPAQLEQVLMNLVVNARDAMPRGGTVTISTRNVEPERCHFAKRVPAREGPHVLLSVRDSGTGMEAEALHRAFEPFYTTKEAGEGTGLGLSTVYGIVRQSQGAVWLDSAAGSGTTCHVLLPRAVGQEARAPAEASSRDVPAEGPTGSETVLVVEDEAAVLHIVERVLTAAGYRVLVARDGLEAERVARRGDEIQLLISDVVMPGRSGIETATLVRRLLPGLRILLISGYAAKVIEREGPLAPGMNFLAKPFTRGALLEAVRETLDES